MTGREIRVVLACNPRSGRGKALRAAEAIEHALQGARIGAGVCRVERWAVGPGCPPNGGLAGADALVIAGGDGSVHYLSPLAMEAGVPVYHVPCGNENLMAREFGMSAAPSRLRESLERRRVVAMDVAEYEVEGARGAFVLMMSMGPDASVIRRVHESRRRAVGHAAYLRPAWEELRRPRFARVTAHVDGEKVVDGREGILLVANSKQYAMRMDPAARARVSDGLLDLAFLPCSTRAGALLWGARSLARRQGNRAVHRQGTEIVVETQEATAFQVDGECPGYAGGVLRGRMTVRVLPGALRVLG